MNSKGSHERLIEFYIYLFAEKFLISFSELLNALLELSLFLSKKTTS